YLRKEIHPRRIPKGVETASALRRKETDRMNRHLGSCLMNAEDIDNHKDSLAISRNGHEKRLIDKDMVEKILLYVRGLKNTSAEADEILYWHFMVGYTMKEVGEERGCTEARISQIIKETLKSIRLAIKTGKI
ncbi:hypothetical protein LCGC14_2798580, partial [marine sediment metagenome]